MNACEVPDFEAMVEEEVAEFEYEMEEAWEDLSYYAYGDEGSDGGYGEPDMWAWGQSGRPQPGAGGGNVDRKKMEGKAKHCHKKIKDSIKKHAKGCVQGKIGFDDEELIFPEESDSDIDEDVWESIEGDDLDPSGLEEELVLGREMMTEGMSAHRKKAHIEKMDKKLKMLKAYHHAVWAFQNGICPKEKMDSVAKCMRNVFSSKAPSSETCRNPLEMAIKMGEKHKKYCDKRKECTEKMSESCKNDKGRMAKAACECASKEAMDKGKNEFDDCMKDSNEGKDQNGKAYGTFNKEKMFNFADRDAMEDASEASEFETSDDLCMRAEPHYDPCEPDKKKMGKGDLKKKMKEKKHG